jgi:hypothetical protein
MEWKTTETRFQGGGMKIALAFLQNLWLREPERWQDLVNGERRAAIIRHLLFAYGCLTGRRIKACFGELLEHMIFEEATREIAGDSRTICPPDPKHIKACLEKYNPKVVITFGKVAEEAVRPVRQGWINTSPTAPYYSTFIACPHPAARQKGGKAPGGGCGA